MFISPWRLIIRGATYHYPNHQNGVRGKLALMRLSDWSNDAALAYPVVVYLNEDKEMRSITPLETMLFQVTCFQSEASIGSKPI